MKQVTEVPGLYILDNIMSTITEEDIIAWLDTKEWSTVLPRRTQHYGYEYGYKTAKLNKGMHFDGWVLFLSDWLTRAKIIKDADQCIVNEYTRDQKIGKHIDRTDIFGPIVVSISIGTDTNFIFRQDDKKVEVYVPARSILVLTGDARYKWTHEIPKRLSVKINNKNIKKPDNYRRISLTFRTTI